MAHTTNRKWVITPVTNGISTLNPLITGVITHLLSGMSHQVEMGSINGDTRTRTKRRARWMVQKMEKHGKKPYESLDDFGENPFWETSITVSSVSSVCGFHLK